MRAEFVTSRTISGIDKLNVSVSTSEQKSFMSGGSARAAIVQNQEDSSREACLMCHFTVERKQRENDEGEQTLHPTIDCKQADQMIGQCSDGDD